jgi:long-chain acyl-CoA synthetase
MVATLIAGERRLDGAAVMERALRGVGGLTEIGVREGGVVALMLRNDIAYFEAMLTTRLSGCYTCPVNWHFKGEEAGFILRDSGAAALIAHADVIAQLEGAIPAHVRLIVVEPSAPLRTAFKLGAVQNPVPKGALDWEGLLAASPSYDGPPRPTLYSIPYSSGTTGRPKGIRREAPGADQFAAMVKTTRLALGIEPGMRTVVVAPLYHSAPATYGMQSLLTGDLIVIHPRLDPEQLLADIERYRITHLYLVPTHYVRLLRLPDEVKQRYDLGSLKFVASTGAPCAPAVKRAMIDWWGPVINETYASSETGFITICSAEDAITRPGTAGRLLPGAQMRILDDQGRELGPFEPGVIYCRNPAYPDFTYVNNWQARRDIERDGLIGVGDIGYLDRDGYLYLCDRKADMVISGGVNIYPAEIEAALMALPGIVDCAVFGIPDAEYGEALAAHIELADGTSLAPEAVREFLRARLASYKVPGVIEFAAALPRDESGKIFKRKLREPYWRAAGRRI